MGLAWIDLAVFGRVHGDSNDRVRKPLDNGERHPPRLPDGHGSRRLLPGESNCAMRASTAVSSPGVKRPASIVGRSVPRRTPRFGERYVFSHGGGGPRGRLSPCLRCRPETAPDMGACAEAKYGFACATGSSSSVRWTKRTSMTLAGRLGVGSASSDGCFGNIWGRSPVAVAQTVACCSRSS